MDGKDSSSTFVDNTVNYDTTLFNDNPSMDVESELPTYSVDGSNSLHEETSTDNLHVSGNTVCPQGVIVLPMF